MTDPIADMLTRIRNSLAVKKKEVFIPFSKIKFAIAKILEKENFIEKAEKEISSKKRKKIETIKIILKYRNGQSLIQELRRISKPGCRIYIKSKDIKKVKGGLAIYVLSTSRGMMTDKEAKKRKLGGEVLVEVF